MCLLRIFLVVINGILYDDIIVIQLSLYLVSSTWHIEYRAIVTGAPVHASRTRNISHGKMVRRSIYRNICSKHPHYQICRYERHPQGPAPWYRYIEYCQYTA